MRALQLIVSTTLAAGLVTAAAAAPMLDAHGKCRDNGKFVSPAMCQSSTAGRCRDKTTKSFVKCGTANAEVVPMKSTLAAKPASAKTTTKTTSVKTPTK